MWVFDSENLFNWKNANRLIVKVLLLFDRKIKVLLFLEISINCRQL